MGESDKKEGLSKRQKSIGGENEEQLKTKVQEGKKIKWN